MKLPPKASGSRITALDRGSATCKFMRSTAFSLPIQHSVANSCKVPLAICCRPFAEHSQPLERAEAIPVISLVDGPIRCPRCKAYMCPTFRFKRQGRLTECGLCRHSFEVPENFYCELDDKGVRRDIHSRMELLRGVVDYEAPPEYLHQTDPPQHQTDSPSPAAFVVLDASDKSLASRQLFGSMKALEHLLATWPQHTMFGLILFSTVIHVYEFLFDENCKKAFRGPRQLTISEVDFPFVPAPHGSLLVPPSHSEIQPQIHRLLLDLEALALSTPKTSEGNCGHAALKVAVDVIKQRGGGGCVYMFLGEEPCLGLGAFVGETRTAVSKVYPARNKDSRYISDARLLIPPTGMEAYLTDLLEVCTEEGIGVECFGFTSGNVRMDVGALAYVSNMTGGQFRLYQRFDCERDYEKLLNDFLLAVCQEKAFKCSLKFRTPKGVEVDGILGPTLMAKQTVRKDVANLPMITARSTFTFLLRYNASLADEEEEEYEAPRSVSFQLALLHMSQHGERLIRIMTLNLGTTRKTTVFFK